MQWFLNVISSLVGNLQMKEGRNSDLCVKVKAIRLWFLFEQPEGPPRRGPGRGDAALVALLRIPQDAASLSNWSLIVCTALPFKVFSLLWICCPKCPRSNFASQPSTHQNSSSCFTSSCGPQTAVWIRCLTL